MANTFAPVPGRVAGIACTLGHAKVIISAAATTYTTASGGLPVDFFVPFSDMGLNPADVQEITGYTVTGYLAIFTKGTLTSSAYPWTVRLWTPDTAPAEIANGAVTQTIHANILFYPGSN